METPAGTNPTDSTTPSKHTNWQTGLKRKIQQPVVYKKPTLQTETNIALG
jgi:hypothetical protein